MRLKVLFKLVWIELFRFKKVTSFLVLNFALGLLGFFFLQIFQQSLAIQTSEKAQVVLGGDVTITARKSFSEQERSQWEKLFRFKKKSQTYSLFAMLRSATQSRLVNVVVFDDQYPLFGQFKFSNDSLRSDQPYLWADPELKQMLQMNNQDLLSLGEAEFKFAGTIDEDPSRLFRASGFAARVLIPIRYLQQSKLIQPGSTYSERWSYQLESSQNIQQVKKDLEKNISDPIIQIETISDTMQSGNQALKYFTDYLGLVALVALGLCFLCGSYLLQWIFNSKKKNIAILKTLGLQDGQIIVIYTLQTIFISLLSCLMAIAVVALSLPFLQNFLINQFDLPINLQLNIQAILIISMLGVFGPALMAVPQILQIFELKPIQLLQNSFYEIKNGAWYYVWVAFSVIIFLILSIWQSQSYKIGAGFVVGILVLIGIFYFFNILLLKFLDRFSKSFTWLVQYGIKGLTRRAASTSLVFITMSLSTLVLSLLPHIKASILHEIRPEEKSQIPNLFLFDIQPEQVSKLKEIIKLQTDQPLSLSPLVRSRILKINDQNYERLIQEDSFQTREAEAEARFRNRGINLTYRSHLQPSEKTVSGLWQSKFVLDPQASHQLPQISVEEKYAERVGLKLKDIITFDVQGLEIKAQVGSYRQVRWTSFQPNFFILFPEGVLEEAPQIFLTSVSQISNETSLKLQKDISDQLKNVSVIDVTQTVKSSLKYIDQMSIGLQVMAWLAVAVGLFVFVILLNTQVKERLTEMNLLQILGCQLDQIQKALFFQFLILISLAVFFGIGFGLLATRILVRTIFDLTTVYDYQYILLLVVGLFPISVFVILWGLRPLKTLNPMDLIRQTN